MRCFAARLALDELLSSQLRAARAETIADRLLKSCNAVVYFGGTGHQRGKPHGKRKAGAAIEQVRLMVRCSMNVRRVSAEQEYVESVRRP